jgi:DNA-binding NarL/FixJ family response regulator
VSEIRVVIADDQAAVREGLALLVGMLEGIEVVGAVADGGAAADAVAASGADVLLCDLRMPRVDGVEAITRVVQEHPSTGVVVLTTHADDADLLPALRAGARGYLTKDATASQIEQAIRDVAEGRTHLAPEIQARLVAATASPAAVAVPGGPDELTPREVEVLQLIAAGLSNDEIAARLVISRATTKTHVNHILAKTRSRDRAQAVIYAYREGIAAPADTPP